MWNPKSLEKIVLNRRQLIRWGLAAGVGLTGSALGWKHLDSSRSNTKVRIPPLPNNSPFNAVANPLSFLRDFDYGKVTKENGRTVREFRFEAQSAPIQLNKTTSFITWNLNGRVPGPTIRVTQGDRIRVIFYNRAGHSHSLHFHGAHPADMDGVKPVKNNSVTIYEFDAEPYGVHLYHCHIAPVARHIGKGIYGMMIIDPPTPRPPADEMVLIMGGYDTNDDRQNELYAFNGLPNYYMDNPIPIQQDQLVRLYVLNLIELDPVVTFHLHANMFKVYRTGRTLEPSEETDVITMGTAERHILEFTFRYPGRYMFHPHQDTIAEAGCMGMFEVVGNSQA